MVYERVAAIWVTIDPEVYQFDKAYTCKMRHIREVVPAHRRGYAENFFDGDEVMV